MVSHVENVVTLEEEMTFVDKKYPLFIQYITYSGQKKKKVNSLKVANILSRASKQTIFFPRL